MKKKYFFLAMFVISLVSFAVKGQSTLSATYGSGDIPTSYGSFDPTCNGSSTTLTIQLPAGGPWEVTGFDVEYDMTAASGAWMSEQRSQIHFQNAQVTEPTVLGSGNSAGTYNYSRTSLTIANGYYAGGDNLVFEMQAWRTWGGSTCDLTYNKVDGDSWTITVYYQTAPSCLPVQDIMVNNITKNEAEVSWMDLSSPVGWNVEYGEIGFSQGSGTVESVTTNPYMLIGLSPGTEYDVYVQADCGGDGESDWHGPVSFWTEFECSDYDLEITDTNGATIVCGGRAILYAEEGGDGNEIYWYDAASGGEVVGVGGEFETPDLDATTSFWVSEVILFGDDEVACESPRVEVTATISSDGDVAVASLPFSTTDDTSNYGNTYSGVSGSNCGSEENYLNGNDVVYKYTATDDELINISLSNLSGFYGGLFIYESCADLGEECVAGAVAGASDEDFGLEDFSVTAGQDYYIVISSWLNPSIGYTLDIIPFDCAAFETPQGEGDQDFVQGDEIADIEVEGTKEDSVLTWYDDAAGTNEIPDTTVLVDNTTYYVSQTFNECESALLAVTVHEIDCSGLGIASTVGDSVSCRGTLTLEATASGTGSEIYWYDAATDGDLVGFGSSFETPELTQTTSYYAAEVIVQNGGSADQSYCMPAYGTGCTGGDDIDDFVMLDAGINHLGSGCSSAGYGDFSNDNSLIGTMVPGETYDFDITHNYGSQYVKIWIDLDQDGTFDDVDELLFTSSSGSSHTTGSVTIPAVQGGATVMRVMDRWLGVPTDACDPGGAYGETHDYTVLIPQVMCESPREEVIATVTGDGDVVVNNLPYNTADNTGFYGNSFSGVPGSDCGTVDNYLDGDDVVYQYTPTADDIVNIELSSLTNDTAGVFVYESCGEIGEACIAGAVYEDGTGFGVEELYLTGGQNYFIVISASDGGSTNYVLDISGFECSELNAPIGEEEQYFVTGDILSDLSVEETQFSEGLTWYSDAAGTTEIPDTTTLVDNAVYYVSQTVLGCESGLLAVTAVEFDCSDLTISSVSDGVICGSGSVVLQAQSGGIGNDVYWYDAPTDGDLVGIGAEFQTQNLAQTTSYWVSEVYTVEGAGSGSGNQTYCTPTYGTGCSWGDSIDDFVMLDAGINHLNSGCSSGGYADFIEDPNLLGTVVAGLTYDFEIIHGFDLQRVKIWIDFNHNGSFEDEGELLFASPSAASGNTTTGSITIPQTLGGTTVMRVMDSYSSAPVDSCNPGGSYGETHDYAVNIIGTELVCESDRTEVVVTVNAVPEAPVGDEEQTLCAGTSLGDIAVNGNDIVWYGNENRGEELPVETLLEDGVTYYATQTTDSCESADILAVNVSLIISEMPEGDINQSYVDGETIADLEVEGENLVWYSDEDGTMVIPNTTPLIDQTTYYVAQVNSDECESQLLNITVHQVLNVGGVVLEDLVYYPNPMKEVLTITNNSNIDVVEVYNLLGQKVMMEFPQTQSTTLDVSGLATGAYLLEVTLDRKRGVYKLIKE